MAAVFIIFRHPGECRDPVAFPKTLDPVSSHVHVLHGMTSQELDPGSAYIHVPAGMTFHKSWIPCHRTSLCCTG
jgi:hypothetical protein